jgi:hypothetical protein
MRSSPIASYVARLRASARRTLAVTLLAIRCAPALALTDDGNVNQLTTVTVVASGVSTMAAASAGDIGPAQIASQPLLRPAAVLENIPGLIVTQHSGEGKANQYFLRAFNLDHGTDFALEVDDMPVNLVSHAHGQGYSDLNFLIPELIADLHYKKGPYYADEGDFATAGAARVDLVAEAPANFTFGYGEDGYRRALAIGSTAIAGGTLLGAGEIYHNDGPFHVPDDYQRLNGVLRYWYGRDRNFFTLTAMGYSGDWNATDQVPSRAVAQGLIDRFATLNPSDGGQSRRASLSFSGATQRDDTQDQLSAYLIHYRLDLWSTFTYFLKDPQFGDQMLQHDDRVLYGLKGSRTWFGSVGGRPSSSVVGVQLRVDDIRDVGIFPTFQRHVLGTTQDAGVRESSVAVYGENTIQWRNWLRTVIGLRADRFGFEVTDRMRNPDGSCDLHSDPLGCDTGSQRAALLTPKAGAVLGPWARTTVYLNFGDGYHSNDARGVTRSTENPQVPPVTPLTRATGVELGVASSALENLTARLDVFQLKLRSELVFSGDAGVTSPSGASTRTGVELTGSLRINDWLGADLNAAFTRARFDQDARPDDLGCSDAAPGHTCAQPIAVVGRYIPNSPTSVINAGLTAGRPSGCFAALRARHFGASALVEDNSARSPAYTTVDGALGFRGLSGWTFTLQVFNLANVRWNDIEYYYVSRLHGEPFALADYIVHPGVPRTLRAQFQYQF